MEHGVESENCMVDKLFSTKLSIIINDCSLLFSAVFHRTAN